MSQKLFTLQLTEVQCYVLACACEIEAQTLEDIEQDDSLVACRKWSAKLREVQNILVAKGVGYELKS